MIWEKWFATSWTTVAGVMLSSVAVYAAIILYVRVAGLRSFSKMTAPDFAMTVAVGSLFGSAAANPSPSVLTAFVALAMLFAGQKLIARLRVATLPTGWLENTPVMLVRDGEIKRDAMRRCGVTDADLRSKLREANAASLSSVQAVVFEATGDISVLHGGEDLSNWLLEDVRS